jgi:hypothetical protein
MTETKIPIEFHDAKKLEGSTIDDLVPSIQSSYVSRRHEAPCPRQTTEKIEECPEVNEWILNHLPLKEEQKQWLMNKLILDQQKKHKAEKLKKWKLTSTNKKSSENKQSKKVDVKSFTKSNSK